MSLTDTEKKALGVGGLILLALAALGFRKAAPKPPPPSEYLTAGEITISPVEPHVGDAVLITITITSIATEPMHFEVPIVITPEPPLYDRAFVFDINPGQYKSLTASSLPDKPGDYTVGILGKTATFTLLPGAVFQFSNLTAALAQDQGGRYYGDVYFTISNLGSLGGYCLIELHIKRPDGSDECFPRYKLFGAGEVSIEHLMDMGLWPGVNEYKIAGLTASVVRPPY